MSPEGESPARGRSPGLAVLYEDSDIVAVDKPAGIHSAPLSADPSGTLLGQILERWPQIARIAGRKPVEPGLLHRLDRETSGIVIAARTQEAFQALSRAFAEGRVKKEYAALCRVGMAGRGAGTGAASGGTRAAPEGNAPAAPPGPELRIESRFAPYGPGRRMVRVIRAEDADRPAARKATRDTYVTEARIERVHGGLALVRARISRGFRHQVRAHLAALGLPIVGDPLYGAGGDAESASGAAPPDDPTPSRMFLHACLIVLESPSTGRTMEITSPIPQVFMQALEKG